MSSTILEEDDDSAEEITISNEGDTGSDSIALVPSTKLYTPLAIETCKYVYVCPFVFGCL